MIGGFAIGLSINVKVGGEQRTFELGEGQFGESNARAGDADPCHSCGFGRPKAGGPKTADAIGGFIVRRIFPAFFPVR